MQDTTAPAEVAGIPIERLSPRRDDSVREYDRPIFTETEALGRHQDPEARCVRIHPPGSEVAEALRPIMEARRAPRPATQADAHMQDEAALICEVQAKHAAKHGLRERAARHEAQAKAYRRSGWMIRRHLNAARVPKTPEPVLRPTSLSAPRERRERRASSPSRAGPGDDSESSEAEPPERRYCQNRRCGADITYLDTAERSGPSPEYCPGGACKQAAYRDRKAERTAERDFKRLHDDTTRADLGEALFEFRSATDSIEPVARARQAAWSSAVFEKPQIEDLTDELDRLYTSKREAGAKAARIILTEFEQQHGREPAVLRARSFVTAPTIAKPRTTKKNRSRAAKLAAENRRTRELQIAEGQWIEPAPRGEVAA